jgi:hypothetical protein
MVKELTLSICLFVTGCGSPANNTSVPVANNPVPAAGKPSPTPKITDEARKAAEAVVAAEKDKAFQDFVSRQHKGWTLQGFGTEVGECDENDLCDLHLVSGPRTKVVPVILRQFTKPDGTTYWFVFEARSIDLLKDRVDAIFQNGQDSALENLTFDNCENICADESEAARERMEYPSDDLAPADPRYAG